MKKATTIGLDIAKSVFQVHGVDAAGQAVLRQKLSRSRVLEFFANLPRAWLASRPCAWGRVDHLGSLTEILRTYHGWRDHPERLHVLNSVAIESVNGASRNAQCLPQPDMNLFFVHSPSQHSVDAVDRLLVMVVAMRWSRQALRARNYELKGRDTASRCLR
jgi:transposase